MSAIQLNGSTSGSVTLTPPAVAGTNTLTLPAVTDTITTNTATQTLTNKTLTSPSLTSPSISGAVVSSMASSTITSATAVAASGTSVTFTGIPSWVKKVTLILSGVSTSGTSIPIIQLGTSGGITSSGYTGAGIGSNATAIAGVVASSGFPIGGDNASTFIFSGNIILTNISGNIWCASYNGGGTSSGGVRTFNGGGSVTLSSVLTQVRYTATNGTDTLTAGTLNIFYE